MLKKLLKTDELSANQKANRRISLFSALTILMIVFGLFGLYPNNSLELLKPLNGTIMWFALFCVVFTFINLFNKEKVPGDIEFNNKSYFSLLVTLGMGVGIMCYGFNEAPILSQYSDVRNPISLCLTHWIIVPWSIYLAFTIFEIYDLKYKLLPDKLRTIKTYLYGLMMMNGIGISFALGVNSISDSLRTIYGIDIPSYALVILLGGAVTISLLRGIHKGMKVLSNFSMYLLYIFMIVLIIVAPNSTGSNFAVSIKDFFTDFVYNNVYRGSEVQNAWTCYYWIWWIGWAAFVAPFVVTISKGRSIRSIVLFTVILPSILIAVYMILGNSIGLNFLSQGVETSMIPFESIKFHWLMPIVFILLMTLFYVTSSDSQSFAMDCLISKGSKTPIVYRKILWVFLEVLFVTILLLAGSGTISAIQGLGFLLTPLMIIFAVINVVLITKFLIKTKFKFNYKEESDDTLEFPSIDSAKEYFNSHQDDLYNNRKVVIGGVNYKVLNDELVLK